MKSRSQVCITVLFILCNMVWIDKLNTLLVLTAVILTLLISGIDIFRNFYVITEYQIMTFSISGMIMNVLLMWHYLVDESFDFLVQPPLNNGTIVSWLLLVAAVNVTAYCIYDGKQLWHGANAIVGFFILFLQKNIPGIFIIGIMFLAIPYIYRPTRKIIKRDMQMFFVYMLMLCNMPFLIRYTELLIEAPSYDLRTGIYTELIFAVFGAVFLYLWEKEKVREESDRQLMPKIKEFFGKIILLMSVCAVVTIVLLVKGNNKPITESILASVLSHTGLFEAVGQAYGIIGIVVLAILFYIFSGFLLQRKGVRLTRQQKLSRLIAIVYILQSVFLTQSVTVTTAYLIFVIAYINSIRIAWRNDRKGDVYEVNDPDTVLQRGEDTGDSAE